MSLDFGRGYASSTQDEGTMYNTRKLTVLLFGYLSAVVVGLAFQHWAIAGVT
jgi:hypothetical protein